MIIDIILESNKLIAEFMGYTYQIEEWCGSNTLQEDEVTGEKNMYSFKPESRWDDLMPVVEKMEKIGYCMDINPWEIWVIEYVSGDESSIFGYDIDSELTKIENWYFVVVKFIKWYNQQKAIN